MTDYAIARRHMVDSQIKTNGVITPGIIEAFEQTPREEFVPKAIRGVAYTDEDVSLGHGRFLLEPSVHAKLVEAAKPTAQDVVLDIGCGTGYSTTILSPLTMTVIALEENQDYLDRATALWEKLGANNVASLKGPLNLGSARHAPFSLIFINGAVAEIPQNIVTQLSPQGRLLTVLRKPGEVMGQAVLVKNLGNGQSASTTLFGAASPYVPGFEPKTTFVF